MGFSRPPALSRHIAMEIIGKLVVTYAKEYGRYYRTHKDYMKQICDMPIDGVRFLRAKSYRMACQPRTIGHYFAVFLVCSRSIRKQNGDMTSL